MATVKETLIAARALIDTPEKWIKSFYSNHRGGFCALGAVTEVIDCPSAYRNCRSALQGALPVLPWITSREFGSVGFFNDHRNTTHSDIMALFDRAIAAQDGKP